MPLSMSTSIMYYTVTPDRSNKSSRDQAPCNIVPAICLIPFFPIFYLAIYSFNPAKDQLKNSIVS